MDISYTECKEIGIKTAYSIEEFGKFETLCARYARSMDFLIRKMLRTIDAYEFENQETLIDVVNNAHKRELISDIEELRIMKDLRNTIIHEYIEDDLVEIFEEVVNYTGKLKEIINRTLRYVKI